MHNFLQRNVLDKYEGRKPHLRNPGGATAKLAKITADGAEKFGNRATPNDPTSKFL